MKCTNSRKVQYNKDYHPFIYQNGKLTDIGASLPAGEQASANAINNLGQVVGGSTGGPGHAFLYQDGKMTDLGTLGVGVKSWATGINNSGQIIGYSALGNGYTDAFLYQDGKMIDLTMLVQSLSGLTIATLVGIDDAGQVAFNASVDGKEHAFLLNTEAVPEPTSLLVMGLAAAAFAASRRRSKAHA